MVYFWRIWLDILSNYGQNLDQNHPHSFIFGGFIIIIWLVVSTHLKSSWSSKWVHNFPNFRGENLKKNELPPASHISTSWNLTFQLPDFPHRTAAVWTLALQGSSDGPAVALGTFVFWPKAPQAPLNLLIMLDMFRPWKKTPFRCDVSSLFGGVHVLNLAICHTFSSKG